MNLLAFIAGLIIGSITTLTLKLWFSIGVKNGGFFRNSFSVDLRRSQQNPRLLCFIPTRSQESPTIHRIRSTWGPKCNKYFFTSTSSNESLNVVKIDSPLNESLWNIIHPTWQFVGENYLHEYDWFLKIDDDSFFTAENFRYLVRDFNPDDNYYLGTVAYHRGLSELFNLGGGYALSRGTLRKLMPYLPGNNKSFIPKEKRCQPYISRSEDVYLRRCLKKAGIGQTDVTNDVWQRETFMNFPPLRHFTMGRDPKLFYWHNRPDYAGSGIHCCSSRPILWHKLKGEDAFGVYYLMYFTYDVLVDPVQDANWK